MKNNVARTIAEWVLIASVFLSVFLFLQFFNRTRTLRTVNTSLQRKSPATNIPSQFLGSFMSEVMEYSKQHPDIDPILESFGLKQGKNAASKPAGK